MLGNLKKLGSFLAKKGVPLLAGAVAGPAGGIVSQMLGPLFGADEENEDDIIQKISADPEALSKLKIVESNNRVKLQELAVEQDRIVLEDAKAHLADTQSARMREVAIVEATGKRDGQLYAMAWTVILGFLGLAILMCFKPVTEHQILLIMIGALVAGFAGVLNYFFGSSKSSADKTKMSAVKK